MITFSYCLLLNYFLQDNFYQLSLFNFSIVSYPYLFENICFKLLGQLIKKYEIWFQLTNIKSVGFMQQSGFLSKLYQIKPFKVVQSPQTIKKQFSMISRDLENNSSIPKLKNHGHSLQSQKISSQSSSANSSLPGYSVKTETNALPKYSTPSRQHIPLLQSQQNLPQPQAADSSKKMARKYSNNEASPYRVTLPSKATSLINALYAPTPRTPNKENKVPLGNMIESVVYTSLTSSIDTLFSKIEKIKQQFQCPLTVSANKSKGKSASQKQKQKNSRNSKKYEKSQPNQQNKSQIKGYSPMADGRIKLNIQSSLTSLDSIRQAQQKAPHSQQNLFTENQSFEVYPQSSLSLSSIPSQYSSGVVPIVLQNTCHSNIDLFSNRTKSIIDDINLLLQSSQKNNQSHGGSGSQINSNNGNKFKRVNTYNDNQKQFKYRNNRDKVENNCSQFDEFDGEFVPIKLKTTQSQYQPILTWQQTSVCLASARSKPSKQQSSYEGVSYKIQKPLLTQPCQNSPKFQQQSSIAYQKINACVFNNTPAQCLSMREFQLGKCVGSGKFGDVHICKHKATGFIFALKKIFKSTIVEYNMVDQFIQQLRIHYTLSNNSPNITKLYTHFQDEYHIFLLMEYIEDGTLMAHLKKSQEFVSGMISQVLDAIECLHRNNIAHRDLKPENILLTNGIAKLCDFGWSSTFKNEMRRTFCGTLDYVSPEMKDKGQYNTSVDLWSIGILTFQLLAGFPPHKKEIDKWKIMGANIKNKWKWDVVFPKELSECARQFIDGLLKQNPDERISIRECRRQQFITKYIKKQSESALKQQIQKVLA